MLSLQGAVRSGAVHFGGLWRGAVSLRERDRAGLGQAAELDTAVCTGRGQCTWPDRSRYEGQFRAGCRTPPCL
jgi:hypothetical protein